MSIMPSHIEMTPSICRGRPRITGHRIRVQDVVALHERGGYSPDEIVSMYPGIGLAEVYAALSYYHDHADEIRSEMESDEKLEAELRATTPTKLAQKLMVRQ